MPETQSRQLIVNAVKARMALIDGTGGYYTTLGQNSSEWRATPLGNAEAMLLDIRDGNEERSDEKTFENDTLADYYLSVTFVLFFRSGTVIENVRKGITDVYKAIGVDEQWGLPNVVHRTLDDGNEIMMSQSETKVGDAEVRIRIHYRRSIWAEA